MRPPGRIKAIVDGYMHADNPGAGHATQLSLDSSSNLADWIDLSPDNHAHSNEGHMISSTMDHAYIHSRSNTDAHTPGGGSQSSSCADSAPSSLGLYETSFSQASLTVANADHYPLTLEPSVFSANADDSSLKMLASFCCSPHEYPDIFEGTGQLTDISGSPHADSKNSPNYDQSGAVFHSRLATPSIGASLATPFTERFGFNSWRPANQPSVSPVRHFGMPSSSSASASPDSEPTPDLRRATPFIHRLINALETGRAEDRNNGEPDPVSSPDASPILYPRLTRRYGLLSSSSSLRAPDSSSSGSSAPLARRLFFGQPIGSRQSTPIPEHSSASGSKDKKPSLKRRGSSRPKGVIPKLSSATRAEARRDMLAIRQGSQHQEGGRHELPENSSKGKERVTVAARVSKRKRTVAVEPQSDNDLSESAASSSAPARQVKKLKLSASLANPDGKKTKTRKRSTTTASGKDKPAPKQFQSTLRNVITWEPSPIVVKRAHSPGPADATPRTARRTKRAKLHETPPPGILSSPLTVLSDDSPPLRFTSTSASTTASTSAAIEYPDFPSRILDASDHPLLSLGMRVIPDHVQINPRYPLFYRRFVLPSFTPPSYAPQGMANDPKSSWDLYTPRLTRGLGKSKVGLCPICLEPPERGGEDKKQWLGMKVSAYNYHMQFYHGISHASGLSISPPLKFRLTNRANAGKIERTQWTEGLCHHCNKWIPCDGVKDVPTKVPEIFWWKHAASCHRGANIAGEGDWYIVDDVVAGQIAQKEGVNAGLEGTLTRDSLSSSDPLP